MATWQHELPRHSDNGGLIAVASPPVGGDTPDTTPAKGPLGWASALFGTNSRRFSDTPSPTTRPPTVKPFHSPNGLTFLSVHQIQRHTPGTAATRRNTTASITSPRPPVSKWPHHCHRESRLDSKAIRRRER